MLVIAVLGIVGAVNITLELCESNTYCEGPFFFQGNS